MIDREQIYHLNNFINVAFQKQKYELDSSVVSTINELNKLFNPNGTLGALFPTYYETPKKSSRLTNSSFSSFPNSSSKSFERQSPIKKEQTDINEVRFLLNKISEQNFTDIKDKLIAHIDSVLLKDDHDLNKLSTLIFDLASTNSFYSSMYARLFALLLEKYDWLNPQFIESLENCKNSFIEFRSCNPNENYNLFCEINKENEKRKSTSKFIGNLLTFNIVGLNKLVDIQHIFLAKVHSLMEEKSNQDLINEIVENIFIYSQSINVSNDKKNEFTECIANLKNEYLTLSNINIKEKPGMSNKSIFKFMDMYEALE